MGELKFGQRRRCNGASANGTPFSKHRISAYLRGRPADDRGGLTAAKAKKTEMEVVSCRQDRYCDGAQEARRRKR
jgi:hypothetical protein